MTEEARLLEHEMEQLLLTKQSSFNGALDDFPSS
jgi:hypothetical protein